MPRGLVDDDSKLLQEDTTDMSASLTCLPLPLYVFRTCYKSSPSFSSYRCANVQFVHSAATELCGQVARGAQPVGKVFKILEDLQPLTMKATGYCKKSGATYPATKKGMLSNGHN
jgi:hypothetical protein